MNDEPLSKPQRLSRTFPATLRPIRPSTECASSSQCQIFVRTEIGRQRTDTRPSSASRPSLRLRAQRRSDETDQNMHRKEISGRISGRLKPALGESPHPSSGWWSQTGSNRRPHACKARALPTELWPRRRERKSEIGKQKSEGRLPTSGFRLPTSDFRPPVRWWAWEDLNLRPHAYQARALTN